MPRRNPVVTRCPSCKEEGRLTCSNCRGTRAFALTRQGADCSCSEQTVIVSATCKCGATIDRKFFAFGEPQQRAAIPLRESEPPNVAPASAPSINNAEMLAVGMLIVGGLAVAVMLAYIVYVLFTPDGSADAHPWFSQMMGIGIVGGIVAAIGKQMLPPPPSEPTQRPPTQ